MKVFCRLWWYVQQFGRGVKSVCEKECQASAKIFPKLSNLARLPGPSAPAEYLVLPNSYLFIVAASSMANCNLGI